MTSWLAFPPADEVRGTVVVPPSKSATNRALVLAAVSGSRVELARPLESDDTRSLVECLRAMGARIEATPDGLAVSGPLGVSSRNAVELDVRDSGTAARFLAALATLVPAEFRLTGSARLRERPMGPLVEALRRSGADIREEGEAGRLPLAIRGGTLPRGAVEVDASESSQYVSALLLLAAAAASGGAPPGLEVTAAGRIASEPYVATTLDSLAAFGYRVGGAGRRWSVEAPAKPIERYETPGDYSSAVPLVASAGICGGEITVRGLTWPSRDADAGALPVLERMGIAIDASTSSVVARGRRGDLRAGSFEATDFPDSVPALAAVAAFAPGETRFEGIAHLRLKESDRLAAISETVRRAGRDAAEDATGLSIRGSAGAPAARAELATFGDHRIAMAAALLALGVGGIRIENPDCVAKSYPRFFRDLDSVCRRGL